MKSKNLYQRLKDKYRINLIENKSKWNYLAEKVEEALEKNNFVIDLTVNDLGYICDMCELSSWDRIYELFNEVK